MKARILHLQGRVSRPDGTQVAYSLQGDRASPALLLLQGQANDRGWWARIRADFSPKFLTVVFDYRGTGVTASPSDADGPEVTWSTELFADDAAAVLDGLGIASAHVYGTSMGGRVAQQFALRHPDRLDRLVLAGTSPGGRIAVERSDEVRRALSDSDADRRRRNTIDLFYSPRFVQAQGGYGRVPLDLLGDSSASTRARHRHLLVSARHDVSDHLHLITAPTLILHGGDDRMVPPANAELLAAALPSTRIRVTAGGRHGFFDEFRPEISEQVLAHLRG